MCAPEKALQTIDHMVNAAMYYTDAGVPLCVCVCVCLNYLAHSRFEDSGHEATATSATEHTNDREN